MSDFAVTDDELKKLLKISRKGPIPFAYCPGVKVEGDLFALHRKKPPAIMAKALRAEGESNKVAFGTVEMQGKMVSLRCERVLPSLAKKVKKFLKLNKVMRNVRVLDEDGNVLEEDVEDLPDDPEEDGEDLMAAEDAAQAAPDAEAPAAEDAGDTAAADGNDEATAHEAEATAEDLRALAARAKALQPQVMAAAAPAGDKLRQALSGAVAQIKAKYVEGATRTLDLIEQILGRSTRMAAGEDTPPAPEPATAEQPGAATLKKLLDAAQQLARRVKALPEGDAHTMLATQVRDLVGSIRDGAVERAISGLRDLRHDLELAEANVAAGQTADADEPATAAPEPASDDPLEIWNTAKESTDRAISDLQGKLRQISDPDLERIAEYGLNGITEGNQVALMKTLFNYRVAGADGRAAAAGKLRAQCDEYRKFLAGSELITLCENNPFGVAVDLRGPLSRALDDIDDLIKA